MVLIIGAGISGLSFANFYKNDEYIIYEAENEPGGYCRTIKKDGYVWDYSGHFFHFRDNDIKQYLLERIDTEILDVQKKSQIYYKNSFVDFPFQKNIHQLEKEDFIECLYDLYFRPTTESTNFYKMLISKFGKSISEKFLIPYNEKLYACDLTELDKDAMGRFFPYADINEIIKNFKDPNNISYNSSFTYPREGAFEYVKALLKGINSNKIVFNKKISKIDLGKKVAYCGIEEIKYDKIVSSIPFNKLLDICDIEYDKNIYTYNKVLVFNLGFDKPSETENHWIYYPERDLSFYRVGFYDNIFGDDRMSLYVEVGLSADKDAKIEPKLEKILEDLRKVGIVKEHNLIAWSSLILDPAYVHINEKSQKDFLEKNNYLNENDIYSIGRYGGWKYCSIEDNILEAKELAKEFFL